MPAKPRPQWTLRVLTPDCKVHTIIDTSNKAVERLLRLMYPNDTRPDTPFQKGLNLPKKRRLT